MADIMGIGLSGLLASQRSLTTTGNNISNVNTEGYSRQVVDLSTRTPQRFGTSFVGSGVEVANIRRVFDQFLVNNVVDNTSSFASVDTFQQYATTIDNLLGNPTTGLSAGIEGLFGAIQDVANNPSSLATRQSLLSQIGSVASRFSYINNSIDQLNNQVNTGLRNTVAEVNSLAENIAALNSKIVNASGSGVGGTPNDLLDQRDAQLYKLAQLVSVSTVTQDNGAVNVFIGNGQSLVVGSTTQALTTVSNAYDATRVEIGYASGGGGNVEITGQLSGGTIGGLVNFRNQVLDPAKNALGRIAISLSQDLNIQHHLGMDLNGDLGEDLFGVAAPEVLASSANAGTGAASATLINAGDLTTSDYRLLYNGSDTYTLTRLSDGQTFAIDTGGSYPYTTTEIDGISLTLTAGAASGDSFLIRPARRGVDDMSVTITDPAKIAAAVPVIVNTPLSNVGTAVASTVTVNRPSDRVAIQFTGAATYDVIDQSTGATLAQGLSYTSGSNVSFNGWTVQIADGSGTPASGDIFYVDKGVTSADAGNTGGADIGQASMAPPDPDLTDTVTITFTSPTTFNVSGATTGTPTTGVTYTSGDIISFNGWSFTISGTPATGDSFTVGSNAGGVGDNGNMLEIAALQDRQSLDGGNASYQDAYGQLVADVGVKTREASINRDATNVLLNQSIDARDAVSGVNLDEEAANMLKYQQAYQAAAKIIAIADVLFQSILDAIN